MAEEGALLIHDETTKTIKADQQRSILKHLMFGVLAVLILMNWTVHRPIDYEPFNKSLNLFIPKAKNYNNDLAYNILDAYVREQENGRPNLHLFTKFVRKNTSEILSEIELLKKETVSYSFKERKLHILNKIDYLNDSAFNYFGSIITSAFYYTGYPFDSTKMQEYKKLFNEVGLSLPNTKHRCRTVLINSLEVDVLLAEEFWLFQIRDRIHDNYCGFDGSYCWSIPNSYFFVSGSTIKSDICFVKNLPREKWNFKKNFLLNVENGSVDAISYNNRFSWILRAKNLGLNFVHGSINVQYDSVNVTRPFSFSYFVSAPGIALHLDKANVCYVGVPNPISISIPGYPADKVELKVAGAKVTKADEGKFEIYFDRIPKGKVYGIVEAINEHGHTSKVHSMELRLKELPPPLTNFDTYKESGMPVDSFFRKERLEVFAADSTFAIDYDVISFQVEGFTARHQYFGPLIVYGEEFSGNHELVSILNTISAGDRLILSDIIVRAANGRLYKVAPISIFLK